MSWIFWIFAYIAISIIATAMMCAFFAGAKGADYDTHQD